MGRGTGSYIRKADREYLNSITLCMYCGAKEKLSIDHIHPLNKGGNSERSNLTKACNRCNGHKTDFLMEDFLRSMIVKSIYWEGKMDDYLRKMDKTKNESMKSWYKEKIQFASKEYNYFSIVAMRVKLGLYKL